MVICSMNCQESQFLWDIPGTSNLTLTSWFIGPVGYDKKIDVSVTAKNKATKESKVTRKITSGPDLSLSTNCTISPKNGISLVTNFNIICNVTKNPRPVKFFVVFNRTRDDGKFLETIIAYGSVPEFNIKLASNSDGKSEIFIKIEDDILVPSMVKLTVEVNSFLNKSDGVATMINLIDIYDGKTDYSKSVSSLIKLGKYADAFQTMHALVTEQETLEDNEYVLALKTKLTIKILEDMKQIELNSFELMAAISFVGHFILDVQNTDPIDLNLATLLSVFCKKLGGEYNRTVITDRYPYTHGYNVFRLVPDINSCAEYVLKRGAEKPQGFNIEKPKAMKEHSTTDEDYPNYKDSIPESLEQDYLDLLMNGVKTLDAAGYAYSRILAPGQSRAQPNPLSFVQATFGYFLQHITWKLNETTVSFLKNLPNSDNTHTRIVYTVFQMSEIERFKTGRYIQTSILSLNLFTTDGLIRHIKETVDYFFTTDESDAVKNYTGQVTVPTSESDWIPKIIDINMTVIRIEARSKAAIFARFYDIDPVKEILVVVTKFQRPKYEDFKNATVVNHTSSILLPMVHEDTWYYLGILPKKEDALKMGNELKQEEKEDAELRQRFGGDYSLDMNSDEKRGFTATFNYQLLSQLCVEWQDEEWTPADCEVVKAPPPQFQCRCNVIGMLAGHQSNAEHKEDIIKKIHFNIKSQLSFVIYIATTVVIALYCIAICFIILRALSLRKLYFLSDNLKDERYAYFIIVNTSSWAGSGTTSNVTIKMHGSKYESKAHVLNYPDPDKEILQQSNQDWFILTTRKHLGEITHIQLWYDCIGYRPDWYCDNVRIYDLQTKGMWNFVVKQKFTVLKNSTHHYILNSLANEQVVENRKMKIKRFSFGERHTWNIFIRSDDENFSYTERITVVLSHILCTYALALYICYAPSVRLKDGLGNNYFDSYGLLVLYSTLVAVLGFSANIIFVILFRNITRTSTVFHFRKIKKILPPFMKYVTWFLLIGTILTTAIYLITCGFWISFTSSMVWLTVTTLALIINIFILENLYLLLTTYFHKYLSKKLKTSVKYNFDSIIIETEKQRNMLYGKLGIYGLRPYLSHLYKPLSREVLIEKRRREVTKAAIASSFKDMIYFLLYTIVLYILLYVNLDDISAVSTEHVKDMFEDGRFAPFGGINKVHDTKSSLLIGTILTAAIYLFTCGFWISFISSMVWLTVTTLALLMNVFILENLYLSLATYFYKYLSKKLKTSAKYNFDSIIKEIEKQRKMLFGKLGIYGLRPPYLQHLYKPLSKEILVEKRRREVTKTAIASSFKSMIFFILHTCLLLTLVYVNLDEMSAVSTEHIENILQFGRFAPFGGINKVNDTQSLYSYLNETFIPTLHPIHWYGNWNVNDPGLIVDFNTKVLGVARIRQQRVTENACPLSDLMKKLNVIMCNPEYSYKTASRENLNKDDSIWTHQSNKNTTLQIIIGRAQLYTGHGYMATHGRTIDELSRVIFLEFLYNANTNHFNAVTILFERSATQYMKPKIQVFIGTLCYTIIITQLYGYIQILIIMRCKYLKKCSHLIETCVHILNIYVIYHLKTKEQMTLELLQKFETSKQSEYIPYFNVLQLYDTISLVTSILIVIEIIRLWNFLRFILLLRIFESMLQKASLYLIVLLGYSILLTSMFALVSHMMFHFVYGDFKSMWETYVTLLEIVFNFRRTEVNYDEYHYLLGHLCIILINVFMCTLMKVYAIIIIMHYEDSRNYYSNFKLGYSIKENIINEYCYLSELSRRRIQSIRLRAGQDLGVPEGRKVTPKADEYRYANCVVLSKKKLDKMTLVARGIMRKLCSQERSQISKHDTELMDKIILSTLPQDGCGPDSGKIFFRGKTHGKVKFVPDYKLLQMEYVVSTLLSSPEATKLADEEKQAIQDNTSLKRIERIETTLNNVIKIINNIDVVLYT